MTTTVLDVLVKQSPQLQELTRQLAPGIRALQELGRQFDREYGPGIRALQKLGRQFDREYGPGIRALQRQLDRELGPGIQALQKLVAQFQQSPATQAAVKAVAQFQQSPATQAALFGAAWDERLEAAVGRLERAEDIFADAADPKRAVEVFAEDAATVKEAALPEAQEGGERLGLVSRAQAC